MIRRLLITALIGVTTFAWAASSVEAGRFFGRRGARSRPHYRSSWNRYRSTPSYSYSRSSRAKPYMTQSRSAVLDGFFGPGPGMEGYDRSWYVGR